MSDCDESNEEDDDALTKMVKQDMMEGGGRASRTRRREDNNVRVRVGPRTQEIIIGGGGNVQFIGKSRFDFNQVA